MTSWTTLGVEPDRHAVDFYCDDGALIVAVADHLGPALAQGGTAISIATPSHSQSLADELERRGVDVGASRREGTLLLLDARQILSRITVLGVPDPWCFDDVVGGVIRTAARSGGPIRAFGEMVGLLWEEGLVEAALELERLWIDLLDKERVQLYCAYHSSLADDPERTEICRLHTSARGSHRAAVTFDADLDAPRRARQFVLQVLTDWRREQSIEDARLVVSELTNNAVQGAETEVTLELSLADERLRISVADDRPGIPRVGDPGQEAESGRGLLLVAAVSTRWGTFPLTGGKAVWAELPISGPGLTETR